MSLDLDLGSKPVANVKVNGGSYTLSLPTVKQAMRYNARLNKCSDDVKRSEAFVSFCSELGLPKEVAEDLSIDQMTKLANGLMGGAEKK